ncbi:hypothetical protein Tco_1010018 [Tanacetum coccineum]
MDVAAMKHMASNFAKLDKFEGVYFRRWQKKMHFLLSSMSVVYVLTTPIPEDGLFLNGMSDPLFDINQNVESFKELWDSLEATYMAEDASSKKFIVSNFTNYKMTISRPVMEQYNELLGILSIFTQHKMNMDDAIQVSCIIDKLLLSWKDFKHTLKHQKKELTLVELGSHMRIKESPKVQDNDKPNGNNVSGPSVVNTVEHNNSFGYNDNKDKRKHQDTKADPNKKSKDDDVAWTESRVLVCNRYLRKEQKRSQNDKTEHGMEERDKVKVNQKVKPEKSKSKMEPAVVRLSDQKLKTLGERGIECIFVGDVEHSKAFRFSSVPRPSLRIPNGTEDIDGPVVPEKVTEEVVTQQAEPKFRKSKKNRTSKNFGPKFQSYLIEGTRDEVSDQHSYCFNVEDDPKTFDEAIKSWDVAFWKRSN